ncbi:DUF2207 domain-containing protein [Salisediminibacterium selenitireducens]|nr:DUF2207 domain-containing protein [Salisediminibacterium selenitireducens]
MSTFIFALLLFLFLSSPVSADVSYTIDKADIHAHLQTDGTVVVEESFTYTYTTPFNGIVRTLNHPEESTIRDLEAFENGEPLEIQTEEETIHYIYRSGDRETITIDIHYTIEDALRVYEDKVLFFWAFFDRSNESDYEQLTITVHPPSGEVSPVAIGFDATADTERIEADGRVVFDAGFTEAGENGDIKAAFDRDVFDPLPVAYNSSAETLIAERHTERAEAEALFSDRQETLSRLTTVALPLIAAIYAFFIGRAWFVNRSEKQAARRTLSQQIPPKPKMSMPATIMYSYYSIATDQTLSSALLSLVQKGAVRQEDDGQFRLVHETDLLDHEQHLVTWLFYDIGDGQTFSFPAMEAFYQDEANAEHYHLKQTEWYKLVKKEISEHGLTKPSTKFRVMLPVSTVPLLGVAGASLYFSLITPFVISLAIIITVTLFALFHQPRTTEGWKELIKWRAFRSILNERPLSDWQKDWSQDDQMTAFIYGLGTQVKPVRKAAGSLAKNPAPSETVASDSALPAFMITGLIMSNSFSSSSASASQHGSSGGSSPGGIGGGTGAGGGGGGSGGF